MVISIELVATVSQSVRAFARMVEGWMFESKPTDLSRQSLITVVKLIGKHSWKLLLTMIKQYFQMVSVPFRFFFLLINFFYSTFTAFYIQQTYTYNSKIYISIKPIDDYSYLHVGANIQHICDIYIVLVIPFFNNDRF